MAGVYIVTGKLGNGKTLCCVGRIKQALEQGRRVATNLDINLTNMFHRKAKNIDLVRIPDKPTIHDLDAIGRGYDAKEYQENKFGLLVLDECGTWFNARNWNDKTRKPVNDWFLHARKLGWEVYIIIQDISILDSQARETIAEHTVFCRRLDKIRIPFISAIIKTITTFNITAPRVHVAKVVYGTSKQDLIADRWTFRGTSLFTAYSTQQLFLADYPHGVHTLLTPWHLHRRTQIKLTGVNIMRLTKVYWKRFQSPVALATGLLLGISVMLLQYGTKVYAVPESVVEQQTDNLELLEQMPVDPIVEFINNLRITGTMNNGTMIEYQFKHADDEPVITMTELLSMGIAIRGRSVCKVELIHDNQAHPVYCSI